MDSIFIRTLVSFTQLEDYRKKILFQLIAELITAMSNGHSCLLIEDYLISLSSEETLSLSILIDILEKSNICDFYTSQKIKYNKPLVVIQNTNKNTMLYFNRYYQYEKFIAIKVNDLSSSSKLNFYDINLEIERLKIKLPINLPNKNQTEAIQECAKNKFSIITGGPGTGKTTTIFILILILLRLYKVPLKIAIIAPTAKAVFRANESVLNSLSLFSNIIVTDEEKNNINNIQYKTIHKLLGYVGFSSTFKYNDNNYLDYDIIIVDESSMVSLTLYYHLLLAINDKVTKHVIFLGDTNQLSSVEEGHVFSDLIKYHLFNKNFLIPNISVSFLEESNRNKEDIAVLANSILKEDINQISQIANNSNNIIIKECDLAVLMKDLFVKGGWLLNYVELIKNNNQVHDLFQYLSQFSILCNKNFGIMGVDNINKVIDSLISDMLDTQDTWYHGRIIVILENNQGLSLVNGDIGICVNEGDGYKIVFKNGKKLSLQLLPRFSLAYAITIHKAQGSEYNDVMIVLDDNLNNTLSKELIYTAVTRAKNSVNIYVEKDVLLKSIQRKLNRYSGLFSFLQI